jgi:predicted DNA-binding transcriptional regulator YafY
MKKILRIRRLNELLKHHNGYTLIDIMAILNVGERTIRQDLEQIQKPPYNAVLGNDYRGKERIYRYKDLSFNLPLFEDVNIVKEKLDAAIYAIDKFKGIPQFDWLKICLKSIENDRVAGVSSIMSFESNADLEGLEHIQTICDAIANKYPIKLTYKPFHSNEQLINVHPYHLKQFNNRWFMIGKPEDCNKLHNYAIDRILSITHLSKEYIETDIDFDDYFYNVVGVSVPDRPIERVELLVKKERYPYIKTKPLHCTQKHIKEKDTTDFVCIEICVIPNRELVTLLMSFSSDIIVVNPVTLRDNISNKVKDMYNSYNAI